MSRVLFAAGLLALAWSVSKPSAVETGLARLKASAAAEVFIGNKPRSLGGNPAFFSFERIQKERKNAPISGGYSGAFDPETVQIAPLTEYEKHGERVRPLN